MIYIEKNSISIQIPRHSNRNSENKYIIELYNHANNRAYYSGIVSDVGGLDLIYQFENLDFSGLINGEYEYRLLDAIGNVLENGIVQVGDYKNTNKQYEYKKEGYVYNG